MSDATTIPEPEPSLYDLAALEIKKVLQEKERRVWDIDNKIEDLAKSKDIDAINECMQKEYAVAKMEIEGVHAMEYFHNTYMPLLMSTKTSHTNTHSIDHDYKTVYTRILDDITAISKDIATLENDINKSIKEGSPIQNESIVQVGQKMCSRNYMNASLTYIKYLYPLIYCYYHTLPKIAVGNTLTLTDRSGKQYVNICIKAILPYDEANAVMPIDTIAANIPNPCNEYDTVWTKFYHGTITTVVESPKDPASENDQPASPHITTTTVTDYILWDNMLV